MGKTLSEIAQQLRDSKKKVQLIYAFNGVGKTRLSREFKELIAKTDSEEDGDSKNKVLYYNAFTEDLFYWDNDLDKDVDRKLVIQDNSFTDWILREEGKEKDIAAHFEHYREPLSISFRQKFRLFLVENLRMRFFCVLR